VTPLDHDRPIVQCAAIADHPEPDVAGSDRRQCADCGQAIWFCAAPFEAGGITDPLLLCNDCTPALPIRFHPNQIAALRAQGIPEPDIVAVLAMANLTRGDATKSREVLAAVWAYPGGPLAVQYEAALTAARSAIADLDRAAGGPS
jgi:hypothetical protein